MTALRALAIASCDAAEQLRHAHAAVGVLVIEAAVHARLVVGARQQWPEGLQHLRFELGAERVVAPGLAHSAARLRSPCAISGAGERETCPWR